MGDIGDLEHRISAAFDRIGKVLDRPVPAVPAADDSGLRDALQAERAAKDQLAESLRAGKESAAAEAAAAQDRIGQLTGALDAQGIELQRLRQTVIGLRETLRALQEAQTRGLADPQLVNAALLAELDSLRAARLTEIAQMDEILAGLHPLIKDLQDA
jgi:hypothetical protein